MTFLTTFLYLKVDPRSSIDAFAVNFDTRLRNNSRSKGDSNLPARVSIHGRIVVDAEGRAGHLYSQPDYNYAHAPQRYDIRSVLLDTDDFTRAIIAPRAN